MSSAEEDDSEASQCEECGKKIMTKRAMLHHLEKHGLGAASCRICHRTFKSVPALTYHFKEFCSRRKVRCVQCDLEMPSTCYNSHLEAHMRNNCAQCPSMFTNRKSLVAHMAEVHNVMILADAAFPCTAPDCNRNFVKRSSLFHHMQLRHAAVGEYVCLTCGAYVEGKEAFDAHVALHRKWTCEECNESFSRRQQYLVHKIRHEQNVYHCISCDVNLITKLRALEHHDMGHEVAGLSEKVVCWECGERFYTKRELRCHAVAHKVNSSVTCINCSRIFANQRALSCHKCKKPRDDTAPEPEPIVVNPVPRITEGLICEQCGKRFKTQCLLDRHLNYIHREKDLACDFCDYRTYYEVNLRRHVLLHTPQPQQYVCDQCGASFKALSNLKDHNLFVHSDERNFSCEKCNKTFKRRNDLKRHSRSHSERREYVCHCRQAYKLIAHLRRHQRVAHNIFPNRTEPVKVNSGDVQPTPARIPDGNGEGKGAAASTVQPPPPPPPPPPSSADPNSFPSASYPDLSFDAEAVCVDDSEPQTLHLQLPLSLSQFELVDQVENFMNMTTGQPAITSMGPLEKDVVFGSNDAPSQLSRCNETPTYLTLESPDSVLVSFNVAKADGLGDADSVGLSASCGGDQPLVPHAEMATMTEYMSHQFGLVGTQDVVWSPDLEEGLALPVFN